MIKKTFVIIIFVFLSSSNTLFAKSKYFQDGMSLFNNNRFNDAKIKFEQDIVFNPKSELSYLYLAKIFNKQEKKN